MSQSRTMRAAFYHGARSFKPGTAPPSDAYSIVGSGDGREIDRPWGVGVSPDTDRAIRSGTGGLY